MPRPRGPKKTRRAVRCAGLLWGGGRRALVAGARAPVARADADLAVDRLPAIVVAGDPGLEARGYPDPLDADGLAVPVPVEAPILVASLVAGFVPAAVLVDVL